MRSEGRASSRLCFLGTFDSLNPFNLKAGSTAQGMLVLNVYESLMTRSTDEPFTSLRAHRPKSVDTDDARSFVTFHLDPAAHFLGRFFASMRAKDVRFTFDLLKAKGRPQQRAAFGLVRSPSRPFPDPI